MGGRVVALDGMPPGVKTWRVSRPQLLADLQDGDPSERRGGGPYAVPDRRDPKEVDVVH